MSDAKRCPGCKRIVEPDPLVIGATWCARCLADPIATAREIRGRDV